jgi:hypothetical protein
MPLIEAVKAGLIVTALVLVPLKTIRANDHRPSGAQTLDTPNRTVNESGGASTRRWGGRTGGLASRRCRNIFLGDPKGCARAAAQSCASSSSIRAFMTW